MSQPSSPLIVSIMAGAGASSAAIDLYCRRIPNALTFGIAAIGVGLAITGVSDVDVSRALGGLAVGLLLMLPGYCIGASGGGDVKLFAALGTMLGPSRTGVAFLYAALLGAVLALAVAWQRKRLATTVDRAIALVGSGGAVAREIELPTENNRFAYSPAIALGALASALGL